MILSILYVKGLLVKVMYDTSEGFKLRKSADTSEMPHHALFAKVSVYQYSKK